MSTHTPGPWAMRWNGVYYDIAFGENEYDPSLAQVQHNIYLPTPENMAVHDVAKANARLIAAAPDLLQALKGLVGEGAESELFSKRIKAALSAIDKAEGRS